MEFQVFHRYNRLVRRGIAAPLVCQYCGEPLSLELGENDGPVLRCYLCNVLTFPGKNLYDRVKAIVSEHFV